jgi:hypothetical protein
MAWSSPPDRPPPFICSDRPVRRCEWFARVRPRHEGGPDDWGPRMLDATLLLQGAAPGALRGEADYPRERR